MKHLSILFILTGALIFADNDLARKVEKEIQEEDKIQIDGLKISDKDGTIVLEGLAELYGSHYMAGKIASGVPGVQKVENNIELKLGKATDEEIRIDLSRKIERHLRPEPFDFVGTRVANGFVTLAGSVRDVTLKEKAFKEAIWMKGVRGVDNQIELASVSSTDERLRFTILRRLKSEFPEYFEGRHPSIIILVKAGDVALVGSVRSKAHEHKMLSIVRSLFGVVKVQDHLDSQ